MPGKTIPDVLGQYNEGDYSVKLCGSIFGVIPGMQPFQFYNSLEGAAARLAGGDNTALTKAAEIASAPDIQTAVWVADAIDKADMGISVVS
ncbi:MAG TPA: hypothetical protein PK200_05770, partial [Spirochaetota bacterium]|nr:hypothetical protein [Spirochaetota bacterium]